MPNNEQLIRGHLLYMRHQNMRPRTVPDDLGNVLDSQIAASQDGSHGSALVSCSAQ